VEQNKLRLSNPQHIFLTLPTKFRAFVGGFGSGKTFIGCIDLLNFALKHPKVAQGYFAPTYPLIRDIFYPTLAEAAEMMGFTIKVNKTDKEVTLYRSGFYYGTIICRSMENPDTIIGFKVARALVDEIDTMAAAKATAAWNKIIARLRLKIDGVVNGVGVTTTPEGFKFVYARFKKNPTESYSMVQASTYENEAYLPDDYIDTLLESYPSQLISAYLKGEFVNLTSGTVYSEFDRVLNHTNETIKPYDTLHVGMDFNVMNMSAILHVMRDGEPCAVKELTGVRDTPSMAKMLKDRYKEHSIVVYPDASGQNTSSKSASESDLTILKQTGLEVKAHSRNPAVKDRVNAMQAMFCNAQGVRRYKVNTYECPIYTESLEQQAYDKNGEPDKANGHDHCTDAGGYFIENKFPIKKPVSKQTALRL
jgi:hypothetical protein